MATFTFQIVSGANTYASSKTISAADLQRFLTAYQAIYKALPTTDPINPPTLTNQQLVDFVASMFFRDVALNIKRQEQNTASAAVSDVTIA